MMAAGINSMNKPNKMSKKILLIAGLFLLNITLISAQVKSSPRSQGSSSVMLVEGGRFYRDLNKNNKLDIYEDIQQSIDARIEDLITQMTLEEKAGMMFMNGAPVSQDADPQGRVNLTGPAARMATVVENMNALKMTHFNIWDIPADPAIFARWYNRTQEAAEKTRLGIPITIASDPRHHLGKNVIGMSSTGFSQFCEMPGFAAIGDENLVKQFAEIVRQEYMAIGIREALHPQIDLATEPRWARISGNFSEDAKLTARLVKPYIMGLQTSDLISGVACMTKHWPASLI